MLEPGSAACLSKLCLPGAQSEECKTHLLLGHNTSAFAALDETQMSETVK